MNIDPFAKTNPPILADVMCFSLPGYDAHELTMDDIDYDAIAMYPSDNLPRTVHSLR